MKYQVFVYFKELETLIQVKKGEILERRAELMIQEHSRRSFEYTTKKQRLSDKENNHGNATQYETVKERLK